MNYEKLTLNKPATFRILRHNERIILKFLFRDMCHFLQEF